MWCDGLSDDALALLRATESHIYITHCYFTMIGMIALAANPMPTPISKIDVCEVCGQATSTRCSRCKITCYCSKSCQKKDLTHHKKLCKEIARLGAIVKQEEAKLSRLCWKEGADENPSAIEAGDDTTKCLLETHAGSFGPHGIQETCVYISARAEMAKHSNALGFSADRPTVPVWQKIANVHQECLRLNANDEPRVGCSFPFILLNCDRDEHAFVFARSRILFEQDWERHRHSKEGDWVYGNGDVYSDIFQETEDKKCGFSQLPGFVAILLVKLRLVAAFKAKKKEGVEILDNEERQIRNVQKEQIPDLLDVIHEANPTILPALINPIPLLSQGVPRLAAPGTPSEAANVLIDAIGPFNRIAGAKNVLTKRFGSNPTYDTNCSNPLFLMSTGVP